MNRRSAVAMAEPPTQVPLGPLALALFVLAAAAGGFAVLAGIAWRGDLMPGDLRLARGAQAMPGAWVLSEAGLWLGFPLVRIAVWSAGIAAALRARHVALLLAGVLVFAAVQTNGPVKDTVERARPTAAQVTVRRPAAGWGFPSGHAQSSTLIYGYTAVALVSTAGRRRRAAVAAACAATAAVVLIAFERVFDGAHWPSDVAGGALLGLTLLAPSLAAGRLLAAWWPPWRAV